MRCIYFSILLLLVGVTMQVSGQSVSTGSVQRCITMERLKQKFALDSKFKLQFEQNTEKFNQNVRKGSYRLSSARTGSEASNAKTVYTIPVVFHIVMSNPNQVTDAQIQQQLDILNADFAGENSDSTKIPEYFKSLFGKSSIQFSLAQRTESGDPTTGIERVTTTKSSFSSNTNDVKYTASKGVDSWDPDKYFNVWICAITATTSGSILGYATFPGDLPAVEQGVVIDYRTLPGKSYTGYTDFEGGRTLTHETGHYFNLFHIWGDDDGACTGSDYVEDTPDQADASSKCNSGVIHDNCTSDGNGIMYQNYMDYSYDACLVMFTAGQISRMEAAVIAYRSSLLTSDGTQEAIATTNNAELKSIDNMDSRLCTNSFSPVITIRNRGSQTLTSLTITVKVDDIVVATSNWTGSLAKANTTSITLQTITTSEGEHTLTISLSSPNAKTDEEISNDTLSTTYQYYGPVATINESFEGSTFPPTGWNIVNNDGGITWEKVTGIAKTGNSSVRVNNYDYASNDETDDLLLPVLSIAEVDSVYLSFYVAAATYTSVSSNSRGLVWDTLQVMVSTDCGKTYTSLYKKYGSTLVTRTEPTTEAFKPTASEWRKDSVNLGDYIGVGELWIAFRNTTEYENNIYLDDVNLRTVIINKNLKEKGFLVMPNPTDGNVDVQFYPQPEGLQRIQILNGLGQKIAETSISSSTPANAYTFDISQYASGVYIVRAVFSDHVSVKKIVKY
ncbi:M43 family zinc metalloprotease [Xanthocytophaga flava]|uniref:M43 family zinc metalloprotease n=1 Tax=Xanthocytophaga flava TaxID=3048013 RepID=UPI0028D05349|nr:M43 family zinc metalloprotease [Xanthocytophaga flavus]MDJ1473316.1 M43 family zinc metalloprotease [Xanthocytophaga flavus]